MKRDPATVPTHTTGWDRAAVLVLGVAGCSLSYSALQQTAVAIHVRPALCWLFPLAIDGFISYGVRALLVLRTAPLRARLYVWTLFATATAVSVWANALHAVRLNQDDAPVAGLHLGDRVVAVLSTVAPLALAGAVHLYILIARGQERRVSGGHDGAGVLSGQAARGQVVRTGPRPPGQRSTGHRRRRAAAGDVPASRIRTASGQGIQQDTARHADADTSAVDPGSVRTSGVRRSGVGEDMLAVARAAILAEGKVTRKVVARAVRGRNIPLSNDALTHLMTQLRERDGQPD